jgi:flavin-dependent dehydrogenase
VPSYGNCSAWGGPELRSSPFIFNPHGNGWLLNRPRFDAMLVAEACAAGTRLLGDTRVTACAPAPGGTWRLTLRRHREPTIVTAQAIVDATGRAASLARMVGGRKQACDRLVGFVAQYQGPIHDGGYTLVEAVEDGWWYAAPIPPNRMIVTFMTDSDLRQAPVRPQVATWEQRLAQTRHISARLSGQARVWGPRVVAAASHRLIRAEPAGRWLACGDAAIAVDPLSSSGIVRAIRTGEAAGQAMVLWLRGETAAAQVYERLLDDAFAAYLEERSANYALEQRWPDAPFWRRRARGAAMAAPSFPAGGWAERHL